MFEHLLMYDFRWSVLWEPPYCDMLLYGIRMTLVVSPLAWLIACVLGVALAVCRTAPWRMPRALAAIYVECFRNTPLLVQLFFWYFGVPQILPRGLQTWLNRLDVSILGLTLNIEVWSLIVGLAIYTSARVAETLRSGIQSLPKEQTEAGLSTGLSRLQVYHYVIIPQAVRLVLPTLSTEFLTIYKNSSLGLTIAVAEMTFATRQIDSYTFKGLEAATAVTLLYLAISLAIAGLMSLVEHFTAIPGMVTRHTAGVE
jgi:glutamate/aspartate transport system permease protein